MNITALVLLAIVAVSALAGSIGVAIWLVKMDGTRTTAFTQMVATIQTEQANLLATLVLGYRDSPPSSEQVSTEPNESETSQPDVNSLADMPDHIREAYLREEAEDLAQEAMRTTTSSRPSFSEVDLSQN